MKVYKHSQYSYVTIAEIPRVEIDRIDIDLCKQPTETIDKYYARQSTKPTIITNAGFFNMGDGKSIFTIINEGKTIHQEDWLLSGFGICNNADIEFASTFDKPWRDFVSGFPNLLGWGTKLDTSIAKGIDYNTRRTVWAYNDTTMFVVCVESPGMMFKKLQDLLLGLGAKFAINLDGGGSTRMLYKGQLQTSKSAYNRPVDSVLAIYTKDIYVPEDPAGMIYRVQVGAYKYKDNAIRMKDTIRALPDPLNCGYAQAYIRLIDNLYKVQVGAFSVKGNAQRTVEDLKKNGITSYIVAEPKYTGKL